MMLYDSYEIIPVEILLGVGWGGEEERISEGIG